MKCHYCHDVIFKGEGCSFEHPIAGKIWFHHNCRKEYFLRGEKDRGENVWMFVLFAACIVLGFVIGGSAYAHHSNAHEEHYVGVVTRAPVLLNACPDKRVPIEMIKLIKTRSMRFALKFQETAVKMGLCVPLKGYMLIEEVVYQDAVIMNGDAKVGSAARVALYTLDGQIVENIYTVLRRRILPKSEAPVCLKCIEV